MNAWQRDVAIFMERVKGQRLPTALVVPDDDAIELCISLITEEAGETSEALDHLKSGMYAHGGEELIAEMADGLVDTIYVCFYTANRFGLDLNAIWTEVQRTNMMKVGGIIDARGKQQKPSGWRPPNHVPEIERQMRGEYPL